jgi:hypothetical protein
MTDNFCGINPAPSAVSRGRRRVYWSVAAVLLASGVGWWVVVEPYRDTRSALAVLERHGAVVTTAVRDPEWLQLINVGGVLESIVEIQLRGTPPSALPEEHFTSGLRHLQRVLVFETDLTAADIQQLRRLSDLQMVSISGGRLDEQALEELTSLASLQGLYLHQTNVDDAQLAALTKLRGLQTLAVTDAAITDAGLQMLHALGRLQTLNLGHTQVTDEGVKQFQQAVPDCDVFYR